MKKIHAANGYEFWLATVQYADDEDVVYELFLDKEQETYLGTFDSQPDAMMFVIDWLEMN